MRLWRTLVVTYIACCLAACDGQLNGPAKPKLAALVAGAAAAALQPDGTFKLASLPPGLVTLSQARALSVAYVQDVGVFLAPYWEFDRDGLKVDYAHLAPCGRTFSTRSSYEALPSTAPMALRQEFGAFLLTTFCAPTGEPEVSIGVPAIDTALRVSADGVVIGLSNAHFLSGGIAPGVTVPPSPELAVQEVAQQTRRRVTQVPELVTPPWPYLPQLSKWRIELESPMEFQELGDTTRLALSEVYFGYGTSVKSMGLQVGLRCAPTQFKMPNVQAPADSVTVRLADGYDNCYTRIDTVGQRWARRRN